MITKKTRLMSAFAALLMLVSMFAMIVLPASAATYFDEVISATGLQDASALPDITTYTSSSSATTWKVSNRAGLEKMAELVYGGKNLAGYTFIQAADIDMGWDPFVGIGDKLADAVRFGGTYDGNGFVIENLFISKANAKTGGLFGAPKGATIKNVGIASGLIVGASETGSICGECYATTIANCWSAAAVFGSGTDGTAGIAGKATGASKLYNCYNLGVVYNYNSFASGMAGWINDANFELYNCYNAGQIITAMNNAKLGSDGNLFGYNAMIRADSAHTRWTIDTETGAYSFKAANNYYVAGTGEDSYKYFIDNVAGTEGKYDKTITANDQATRVEAAALTATDATGLAAQLNSGDLTKGAVDGYTLAFANSTAGYPVLTYVKDGAVVVKRTAHTSDNVLNADKLVNSSDLFKAVYDNRLGGFAAEGSTKLANAEGVVEIATANDLFALGLLSLANTFHSNYATADSKIVLTADIDCAEMDAFPIDEMFTICQNGNLSIPIDGQNHVIKNWNTYSFIANGNGVGGLVSYGVHNISNLGMLDPVINYEWVSNAQQASYTYPAFFGGTFAAGASSFNNVFVSNGTVNFKTASGYDKNNIGAIASRVASGVTTLTLTDCWADVDIYVGGEFMANERLVGSLADPSATTATYTNCAYAAPEIVPGNDNATDRLSWEPQTFFADVSAKDGSMAHLLNNGKSSYKWTVADGNTVWGTEANATCAVTIELMAGESITDTKVYYLNAGEIFTLPTITNYEVDELTLPEGTADGAFEVTEDITLAYVTTGVDLSLLEDLIAKFEPLDLDLFVNGADIEEFVFTLQDAYAFYTGTGDYEADGPQDLTDPDIIDEFNAEYEGWVATAEAVDFTLIDAYPNYPKYSDYDLYVEWNTSNNWAISTKADWYAFVEASKSSDMKGVTIHLLNDVDFGGEKMGAVGYKSASAANYFNGTLDGHGYALKNININETMNTSPLGLVSKLGGVGVIKNLGIASGSVTAVYTNSNDGYGIGSFAGQADNGSLVQSCWNAASVTATVSGSGNKGLSIAGMVGRGYAGSTISGSYNVGKVTGINHAAGLNDWAQNTGALYNSFNAGTLVSSLNTMIRHNEGGLTNINNGAGPHSNSYSIGYAYTNYTGTYPCTSLLAYELDTGAYESGEVGYLINQGYVSGKGERVYFTYDGEKTLHGTAANQTRKVTLHNDNVADDIVFYAAAGSTIDLAEYVVGATFTVAEGEGVVDGNSFTVANSDPVLNYEMSGLIYVELKAAIDAWEGANYDYFVNGDAVAALVASAAEKMNANSYADQDAVNADVAALNAARVYNAAPALPTTAEIADYPDAPGYMIMSEADYLTLTENPGAVAADKTVYLGADITMTDASTNKTLNTLVATFDGMNHSITGLTVENGLFNAITTLRNTKFVDCHATNCPWNSALLINQTGKANVVLENLTFVNCSATKGNGSNGLSLMVGQYTGSSLLYKNIVIEGCTLNRTFGTGHAGNCGFMGGTHSGTVTVDGAILRNNVVTGAQSRWGWGVAFGELTGTNTLNNIGIFGTTEVDGCGYIANGLVVGQFKNGTMTADNVLAYHDDAASPATNNVFSGDHVADNTKFTSSTNVYNDGNLAENAYKANKAGVSKTWVFEAGATYPTFGTEGLPVKVSFVVGEETFNFYTDVTGAMINADPELATAYNWDKEIAAVHTEDTVYTAQLTVCEHVWGEWTTVDGVHTRECTLGCGETETGNCDGTFAHDAESDPSTHSKTCSVCGDVVTEPCVFTETVTPATHFAGGYTTYTCDCDYAYVGNETEKLDHTWGDWVANEDGTHTRTCTDNDGGEETGTCEYTTVVTEPTCCAEGYTTKTCTVCGDVIITDRVPATNEHNWGEWTVEVPATTTTPGSDKRVCTNDGCTAFETRYVNILSDIGLTVGTVEDAKAGEEVTVTVGVANNTGFAGATLEITYADGLTPVATATTGMFSIFSGITEETDFTNNTFRVSFVNLTNVATDGGIFTITFKVADEAAAGDYAIDVTVVEAVYDTEENIDLAGASGKVVVADDDVMIGDVNGDGAVNSADVVALMKASISQDFTGYVEANADVNADGQINSADVTALMKISV